MFFSSEGGEGNIHIAFIFNTSADASGHVLPQNLLISDNHVHRELGMITLSPPRRYLFCQVDCGMLATSGSLLLLRSVVYVASYPPSPVAVGVPPRMEPAPGVTAQ